MTNIKHFRNVSIIHAYVLLFISILQIIHIDNTDRFLINFIISIIFLYQVLKLDSKQFKFIQNFIQKYYTLAFVLNLILVSSTLLNLYFGVQVLENLLINNKIFFENLTGSNYIMSSFECIINVFINFSHCKHEEAMQMVVYQPPVCSFYSFLFRGTFFLISGVIYFSQHTVLPFVSVIPANAAEILISTINQGINVNPVAITPITTSNLGTDILHSIGVGITLSITLVFSHVTTRVDFIRRNLSSSNNVRLNLLNNAIQRNPIIVITTTVIINSVCTFLTKGA